MNQITKEMAQNFHEEEEEAIKSLIQAAGFDPDNTDVQSFKDKGFSIKTFKPQPLETMFVLAYQNEFVAGSIVSLNFELGQIKRTVIPHFNDLDEKYHKFVKGTIQ